MLDALSATRHECRRPREEAVRATGRRAATHRRGGSRTQPPRRTAVAPLLRHRTESASPARRPRRQGAGKVVAENQRDDQAADRGVNFGLEWWRAKMKSDSLLCI